MIVYQKNIIIICLVLFHLQAFTTLLSGESDTERCYAELSTRLIIEDIPQQIIDKPFSVKASMPSSAIYSLHMQNHSSVVVSITLDGDGFEIFEPTIMQDLAKADGVWEWKVKAKKAGKHKLFFHVEVLNENKLPIKNCEEEREVFVDNLPWLTRTGDYLLTHWIAILSLILGIFNAWQTKKIKKKRVNT